MDYKFLIDLPTELSKAYIKKMSNAELKECVEQLEKLEFKNSEDSQNLE